MIVPRCALAMALLVSAATAAEPVRLCTPVLSAPITVARPGQRNAAARRAEPPLTDIFAWPDTPIGVVRTDTGVQFFASDGGNHLRQAYQGRQAGNNKGGSITTTTGTLDDPLGSAAPRDVSISPNRTGR